MKANWGWFAAGLVVAVVLGFWAENPLLAAVGLVLIGVGTAKVLRQGAE